MQLQCGLLGKKLGHSYSPQIHGMLADYEYRLYERSPQDLSEFLRCGSWDGLNVTIPYKKDVIPYCQELSDVARMTGSVNTLVKRADGTIYGDNTDAWGFWFLLKQSRIDIRGRKALILGNGGACASVNYVLRQEGARIAVISRRGEDHYGNLDRHGDAALIVNTTPVGMYPDNGESPLRLSEGPDNVLSRLFPELLAVIDLIYNPAHTAFMMQAEAAGLTADNGLKMLVAQAYQSSRLFCLKHEANARMTANPEGKQETDPDESAERILDICRRLSYEMHNLILIGMPGSGKSTVAKALHCLTGREIIDIDELFAERFEMTAETCIRREGEESFRRKETEVIREAGKGSGRIIATGGGCVTRPENYPLLHQNGRIIYLSRDLSLLETNGRPLSEQEGIAKLYAARRPMYESFADFTVKNDGTVEETARRILQSLGTA